MLYVAFHRGSQTWSSQAPKSGVDLTMTGCLCDTALQLLLVTPPQSRSAALASAPITGQWATGKNFQPLAENFGGNASSQIVTTASSQAPAVWYSGAPSWEGRSWWDQWLGGEWLGKAWMSFLHLKQEMSHFTLFICILNTVVCPLRGSAVMRAWTQPQEVVAGSVHRQLLLSC